MAELICPLIKNANHAVDTIPAVEPEQDFVLSEREAEAAAPEAMAVCGEEDPGEGLEFLVTPNNEQ